MCGETDRTKELTNLQREYVSSFGEDYLALLNSQLHLCSPYPDIGGHTVKELTISSEYILSLLHLDMDIPDGMSLLERFLFLDNGNEDPGKKSVGFFLTARRMEKFIDNVIIAPYNRGEFTPSEAQEQVLKNLAAVFDRQVVREGNACTVAQGFALKFLQYRPEYLSEEAVQQLLRAPQLLNNKNLGILFGSNTSIEEILQAIGLQIRAATPIEELRFEDDPLKQGALKATALFWESVVTSFTDIMKLKEGIVTSTCHPSDLIEMIESALASHALSIKDMHAKLSA